MSTLTKCYCGIVCCGEWLQSIILLAVRLVIGILFFQAGFGKFGDISKPIEMFANLDIPWPTFNAYLVATVETLGGISLFFGLFARFFSVPLSIAMIVALGTAHHEATAAFFQNPLAGGWEFISQAPIPFLITSLFVFAFGPGAISIDAIGKRACCKKSES